MSQIPKLPSSPASTPAENANTTPNSAKDPKNSLLQTSSTKGPVPGTQESAYLQLPSTSILPQLAKNIAVGDLIQFTVRGRNLEGLGLLYMMGQLIQAKIPDHVVAGDRVHAQISVEGERIIFKIVDIVSRADGGRIPPNYENPVQVLMSIPETLSAKVEDLLFKLAPFIPDSSLKIPHKLPNSSAMIPFGSENATTNNLPTAVKSLLETLKNILPESNQTLIDAQNLSTALQKLTSPETTNSMKEFQLKLSNLLEQNNPSREARFITSLQEQLKILSSESATSPLSSNIKITQTLDRIFNALAQELNRDLPESEISARGRYIDTLKITLARLKDISTDKAKIASGDITKLNNFLENTFQELGFTTQSGSTSIPPQLHRELRTLLTTVEQFTSTQEMMQRLEPILQGLRQPELILFPFLFQGLFSFGELVVDPDAGRHLRDNKGDDENTRKNNKDNETEDGKNDGFIPSLHYQAQLPLPSLGKVQIGSLQSKDEIRLSLQFEDEEKAEFIKGELSELRQNLADLGFAKVDIISESEMESAIIPEKPIEVRV
ncbi:MAG TPA: hypothetical protein PKA63_08825 [Oligoflexia bacterium]|nr:hypothetical protein [Oligoflexia bacterium]HMP48754.1 hypothetical protein [Oligoflexia bacterium]